MGDIHQPRLWHNRAGIGNAHGLIQHPGMVRVEAIATLNTPRQPWWGDPPQPVDMLPRGGEEPAWASVLGTFRNAIRAWLLRTAWNSVGVSWTQTPSHPLGSIALRLPMMSQCVVAKSPNGPLTYSETPTSWVGSPAWICPATGASSPSPPPSGVGRPNTPLAWPCSPRSSPEHLAIQSQE